MNFDYLYYPFPSKRMCTFASKGMVATSHPLAAQAGLEMLKKGGNAIDAAIATAATLTVVEPTSNGLGGDAFALVSIEGRLRGLNASGPSPKNITIEKVKELGYSRMPKTGWIPVTVPGVPAAWAELSGEYGKLPLSEVLQPAISYAEEGFTVTPVVGKLWESAYQIYKNNLKGEEYRYWFETFAPEGRAPEIGETWSSAGHAWTLKAIADSNGEAFYRGHIADKIDCFSRKYGGFLTGEDLSKFYPEWVMPIKVNYRGYNIWELPPNGQGLVALIALKILEGFNLFSDDMLNYYHKQIEAIKLAFSAGKRYITDPDSMSVGVQELLSDSFIQKNRDLIGIKAQTTEPGSLPEGGTVYLATADNQGNMVSYIQSNYMGFGSGLVVPDLGIALQNRGYTFSLDRSHANCLEPGKKTYHTIIPGFLEKESEYMGPFGVMGGYMQPQGHVQVITNMIDLNLNPQAALDACRWQWEKDKMVLIEQTFPQQIAQALNRKSHDIKVLLDSTGFGRGQIILRNKQTGLLIGGTEPRTDGYIAVW